MAMLLRVACLLQVFAIAHAGDWTLSDSVSLSLSGIQRDNDVAADISYLALQARPGFKLSGKGSRVQADINYSLAANARSGDIDGYSTSHSLKAQASSELYEDMVFLSASASAGLANRNATSASVDTLSADSDAVQTYSFTLSPEFRYHLGTFADLVSRNSFRYSTNDSAQARDTRSDTLHIGMDSGRRFSRLGWSIGYTDTTTYRQVSTDHASSFDTNASYRLNRHWQVLGGVGHSENDAPSARTRTSGFTWNVGANWTPNPRTNANARFGHRYHGYFWNGRFTHKTRRTSISATFLRSLTDTTALLAQPVEVWRDEDLTWVIDPDPDLESDLTFYGSGTRFVPSDENFINTSAGLTVAVSGRRTTLTGNLTGSIREYEVTGLREERFGLYVGASRQLSGKTSVNLAAEFSDLDGSLGREDSTFDASVGISTKLGRHSSLGASLRTRFNDADDNTGYSEQRFTVTLSSTFL